MAIGPKVESSNNFDCPVCLTTMKDAVITRCGHSYCEVCIQGWISKKDNCPGCRTPNPDPSPNYFARSAIEEAAKRAEVAAQPALASTSTAPSIAGANPTPVRIDPQIHTFAQPIVIKEFVRSKGLLLEQHFPPKTFQTIHSIAFHQGIVRIVTNKNKLVYRIPEQIIRAYLTAKSAQDLPSATRALENIVLYALRQPNQLQIGTKVNKPVTPELTVAVMEAFLQAVRAQTRDSYAQLSDFIEFDSFDDPSETEFVGISFDRPKEPVAVPITLTTTIDKLQEALELFKIRK